MPTSELIRPTHLQRRALIYIRQSSPRQAVANRESLDLQYGLRQRALDCGWRPEAVDVIDADLGMTGSTAQGRPGFKELVSRVSLGQAGIVFAYDVTRLARNCSDWYQLLDLCGWRQCLIGDYDAIHDPSSVDGRLLLGLRGQISELELHTIRARLTAGLLNKAKRGELALKLPVGLVRDAADHVVKDPDREVQSRIGMIFDVFLLVRAVGQVVRRLNERNLQIPRRDPWGDIIWRKPTVAAVASMLRNPAYAGAFVYGRTRHVPQDRSPQKRRKKPLPIGEWLFRLNDKYPAYVDWETFVRIQAMIRDNYSEYRRNGTRGVPRKGRALLHGLVFCGACGHRLTVQYRAGVLYICNHLSQQYRAPFCQRLPADSVDAGVVKAFWEVLGPAELDLYSGAMNRIRKDRESLHRARLQLLERLRYQARLAERQFNHADPENRLVAAELEARWERALQELRRAEETGADEDPVPDPAPRISDEMRREWGEAGRRLPELWNQGRLTPLQKKSLLRSLIDKVVVHRTRPDEAHVRIVWKGGDVTTLQTALTVGSLSRLSFAKELEKGIVQSARQGNSDEWIAREMTEKGYRSPLRPYVAISAVQRVRLRNRVTVPQPELHRRRIPGYLTVYQLARRLKMRHEWFYDRIRIGAIQVALNDKWRRYLFPDTPETLVRLRQLRDGDVDGVRF